jgi:hypothetical protein
VEIDEVVDVTDEVAAAADVDVTDEVAAAVETDVNL